jgi:hypothetical protein
MSSFSNIERSVAADGPACTRATGGAQILFADALRPAAPHAGTAAGCRLGSERSVFWHAGMVKKSHHEHEHQKPATYFPHGFLLE